jgi:hypothetical protein
MLIVINVCGGPLGTFCRAQKVYVQYYKVPFTSVIFQTRIRARATQGVPWFLGMYLSFGVELKYFKILPDVQKKNADVAKNFCLLCKSFDDQLLDRTETAFFKDVRSHRNATYI